MSQTKTSLVEGARCLASFGGGSCVCICTYIPTCRLSISLLHVDMCVCMCAKPLPPAFAHLTTPPAPFPSYYVFAVGLECAFWRIGAQARRVMGEWGGGGVALRSRLWAGFSFFLSQGGMKGAAGGGGREALFGVPLLSFPKEGERVLASMGSELVDDG